ncbi:MAG: TM2 domain-containing protein [Oscillospiraceae bacterium]|nr:TM2 domain-containing protein [Oscillospiraceae bacterium]
MIAAILAFLLGTFGAHWFYLGRPKRAIWYLLFFWTGIPTLIGFVEGFMLARQGLISDL